MFSSKRPSVDGFVSISPAVCSSTLRGDRRGRRCRARRSRPSSARSPAIVTLAGFVPCAVSGITIFRRCSSSPRSAKYARISSRPVSSPWLPAAGWRLTASSPVTSRRISCSSPLELERALRGVLVDERMQVAEPRQPDEALVDARVVLHRAGAERIEARVDPEVAVRERGEVAQHLGLGELRQARRLAAGELRPGPAAPGGRAAARRARGGPAASARRSAPRHGASASARRSISSVVRFSVTATRSASSRPGVVASERVAGIDAPRARGADRVGRAPSGADRKLLERCLIRETASSSPRSPRRSFAYCGERHAGLPRLAQPLRAEQREVHQPRQREQGLVGGDVRRRLLAPDVLLARLQGEDIAALARGVQRLADDPAREPADVAPRARRGTRSAGRRSSSKLPADWPSPIASAQP